MSDKPHDAAAAADPLATAARPWYARTGLVFGALGTIVLATVLLSPAQGRTGDARLTTLSRGSQGAQLFADGAARLGWRVERDSAVPGRASGSSAETVGAVPSPAVASRAANCSPRVMTSRGRPRCQTR